MTLSYREAVLAKRPVAYWRLGELSGPVAADESGSGRHGVFTGNLTRGEPGAIVADPNSSVRFASGGYVEVPASPQLSLSTSKVRTQGFNPEY